MFDNQFISAIQSGMSYKEFWEEDPEIFWAYRFFYYSKQKEEAERINFSAWLNGLYVYNAVAISLHNSFRDKKDNVENYLEKPIDLFGAEADKEKEIKKENKTIEEQKIKIRALQIQNMLNQNKSKGGVKSG